MWTLTDVQTQIASEVDGNATISTSGADWASRLAPINRANLDWAQSYDWKELLKVFNGVISTSTGNASLSLPGNFKDIDGLPKVGEFNLPIVDARRNYEYSDSDKYVNLLGNEAIGKVMYIHSDALSSGTSVQFTYKAWPASLASTGQIIECPDPSYIVQRSLYYIYKSREDGRFPEAKAEADKILARMIENENTKGVGFVDASIRDRQLVGFRIGRD